MHGHETAFEENVSVFRWKFRDFMDGVSSKLKNVYFGIATKPSPKHTVLENTRARTRVFSNNKNTSADVV